MKVLAICASSRKDGNTSILLKSVLDELQLKGIETELIQLAGKILEPCRACWGCGGKGNCLNKNDCFCEIFEKMKDADGIILGSPVYSANVSSTMQALIERAAVVCDMNPEILKYKVGASVTVATRTGCMQALDTMNHFFLNHDMFVVGSEYWNVAFGQAPGDVLNDEKAVANMKKLALNMTFLMEKIKD